MQNRSKTTPVAPSRLLLTSIAMLAAGACGSSGNNKPDGGGGQGGSTPDGSTTALPNPVNVASGADPATADGTAAHPFPTLAAADTAILAHPDWTGDLAVHPGTGRYEITTDAVIPKTAKLKVDPGVTFAMGPNISVHAQNDVTMIGEQGNEILLTWLTVNSRWGGFTNFEPTSQNNAFEHVIFEHGGETQFAGSSLRGALSTKGTGGHVSHCEFRNNEGDDGYNAAGGSMLIEHNYFHDMNSDCLDTDSGSTSEVRYNLFVHCGNDAVDLGNPGTTAYVHDNVMMGTGDKGVSVGETCSPRIINNLMIGTYLGIGIKDSSTPTIDHNTIYGANIGIAIYEAIQGLGSGKGTVKNTIIWGSKTADITNNPDTTGALGTTVFSYSCIQTGVFHATINGVDMPMPVTGTGILTAAAGCADPMFAAPGTVPDPVMMIGTRFDLGDFHLKSVGGRFLPNVGTGIMDGDIAGTWVTTDTTTSPLLDVGDPASPFDLEPAPNGGRTEIGAYGDSKYASKTPPSAAP